MDYCDDDISILKDQDISDELDGHINVSCSTLPENILPTTRNNTALFALQTAYFDLKKRYNDIALKNQSLTRALRSVDKTSSLRMSYNECDFPMSYNSQGAAAMADVPASAAGGSDAAATQGYIRQLKRELNQLQTQVQKFDTVRASYTENLQKMESKYKQLQEESDRKQKLIDSLMLQVRQLEDDNHSLTENLQHCQKELLDALAKIGEHHRQAYNHDIEGKLSLKIKELENECARLRLCEEDAKATMEAKDKEIEELNLLVSKLRSGYQNQEELLLFPSISANEELAELKKIIGGLKKTVQQQHQFLQKLVKASCSKGSKPSHNHDYPDSPNSIRKDIQSSSSSPLHGKSFSTLTEDSLTLKVSLPNLSQSSQRTVGENKPQRSASEKIVIRQQPTPTEASRSEVILRRSEDDAMLENHAYQGPLHNVWSDDDHLISSYDNAPNRQQVQAKSGLQVNVGVYNSRQGQSFRQNDSSREYPFPKENSPGTDSRAGNDAACERTNSTKLCPVCSRDFSHLNIDDFQSHVFECFDDLNGPETLHAEPMSNRLDKICPMCGLVFPESKTQEEFENHVQTHFDDGGPAAFEVLHP